MRVREWEPVRGREPVREPPKLAPLVLVLEQVQVQVQERAWPEPERAIRELVSPVPVRVLPLPVRE